MSRPILLVLNAPTCKVLPGLGLAPFLSPFAWEIVLQMHQAIDVPSGSEVEVAGGLLRAVPRPSVWAGLPRHLLGFACDQAVAFRLSPTCAFVQSRSFVG